MPDLIAPDEPAPAVLDCPNGQSRFLLLADHAGNRVPRALADLGLPQRELDRHIGIDIGILSVGRALSHALDATLIHQPYSRLVIDCNRQPGRPDAMPEISDGTMVPANAGLSAEERKRRETAIFRPYHALISAEIDARLAVGRPTVLIALHSFTPRHGDFPSPRPWHVGVLWNRDARLAAPLIAQLRADGDLCIGINQPYGVNDEIDYAVPVHAEARGLIHVELEIRQDLISSAEGQSAWASRLARVLPMALAEVVLTP